jgi:transcriptional regulator with XRE-family HTH domain
MTAARYARFDPPALFAALDRERTARGLAWKDLEREIGVAASTMRRLEHGGRYEVDGILFILQWLGSPMECFLRR